MPVMPKRLVIVALHFFRNEVVFELDNFLRGQNQVLYPRRHAKL
jgi:hypothetical protein